MFLTGDQKIVKAEYPKAFHKIQMGTHCILIGEYLLGYDYKSEKDAWHSAAKYVQSEEEEGLV